MYKKRTKDVTKMYDKTHAKCSKGKAAQETPITTTKKTAQKMYNKI